MKQSDINRIINLPTITPWDEMGDEEIGALVDKWNARYQRPGAVWGFFPHQAFALETLETCGCLFAPMSVGAGKSFMSFFMGDAAGAKHPLIVTKASIRDQMLELREEMREHFYVPDVDIWSFAKVSGKKGPAALSEAVYDFIVIDEAHSLKNPNAARTKRLTGFIEESETPVGPMSATFIGDSIHEIASISKLALGDGSPFPNNWARAEAWSRILDPEHKAGPPEARHIRGILPLLKWAGIATEDQSIPFATKARLAVRERLRRTPGVCVFSTQSCDAEIVWSRLKVDVPEIQGHINKAQGRWELPDGSEIEDPLRMAQKTRELAMGGFYRWKFDDKLNDDPRVREWLHARSAFNCAVQKRVGMRDRRTGEVYDTPGLVMDQIREGLIRCTEYEDWLEVRDWFEPEQEGVWVTDEFLNHAIKRAEEFVTKGVPGFLFYSHLFVADRLEELGVRVYRRGERPKKDEKFCALSLYAHGTGLDLQQFGYLAYLSPPSSDGLLEQSAGRIHRNGQKRDRVYMDSWEHVPILERALDRAMVKAKAHEETQGMEQKINTASIYRVQL